MRRADTILDIHQKRGSKGLPLERVYQHLFDPELFLKAYGKIYRNPGAMTKGTIKETVDGMDLQRIHNIIGLLRWERYEWTPVRRTEIPKANGKMRPLGIPTWSDKLVQEVLRTLLEPYYEQRFSDCSHGFRPHRGCHTALLEIRRTWTGTTWFIEGDIKGCFDNIDHEVLLGIIRRDIHDGRLAKLTDGLLRAGYMEDWRYYETLSGTPQGGIISPLLANIYLNELDRFVEDTLIPAYTRGRKRRKNPEYGAIGYQIKNARQRRDVDEVKRLKRERRKLTAGDPRDPSYRRLRYIRYADDFLLGLIGPKDEAKEIRDRLGEFLKQQLRLTLSEEKTLITHATDEKAKFLGHEITVVRQENLITKDGKRGVNGKIALLMPRTLVQKYRDRYTKKGKIIHKAELINDTEYTIVQRYQSVLRGLYNFYCMSINVSKRMNTVKWILETSLAKTLASKLRCRVNEIYRRYGDLTGDLKCLRVVIERPGKNPLVATFGGFSLQRRPEGMGTVDFRFERAWFSPGDTRAEVVQRLMAGRCEMCGASELTEVHHIRALADIDRPGRRLKEVWEKIMSARKRKTLVVCRRCHDDIHAGRHDGPAL